MMKSRRSMQFITTFVMMLFLFQFFTPLVQTGIGHTPKECQKKYDDWKKKHDKATELNTKLKGLENDQVYTIIKETVFEATIGGLFSGAAGWAILKETLENAFKKVGLVGFTISGLKALINSYRETEAEIEKVKKKRDKVNIEAWKLWQEYLKCMNHKHASGSLSPYMDYPTYVQYGETHYALFEASIAFDSVYWYVRAPGETGYGTNISTEEGDGSKITSMCSWTVPHTAGTYTITAYVYFSDTIIEESYDITVSN